MKRMTKERIELHLGSEQRIERRWRGGWFVELQSGASVTISRKGIDFGKYMETENRTNINEPLFQGEVRSCIFLADDIWGGLGLYDEGKPEDRAAMLDYAADVGIKTGDQGLVYRHFGPEAKMQYTWQGFRIKRRTAAT